MPKKPGVQRKVKTGPNYLHIVGAAVLILLIFTLLYQDRHTSFFVNATTRQPQPYTELYFSQPKQLPAVTNAGQTVPVRFTIHNDEARDFTYTYDIDLTAGSGQTTLLSQQQLNVVDGHAATIAASATIPSDYSGRVEVSVVLLHQSETIHYWLEVQP